VKLVFLDRSTLVAELRRPSFPHEYAEYAQTSPEELDARLRGASIAITNKVRIQRASIERADSLRLIAVAATGVDVIDLEACREHGVAVANIRGYAKTSVPEHVFALILALRRSLVGLRQDVRSGAWSRASTFCLLDRPAQDLAGATLGIVGSGAIVGAVAALGRAFGMTVLLAERRGAAVTRADRRRFDEVLESSDVLSLHCPLTPETRGLIGREELARMKPGAIVINTARGGLVDESALARALSEGRIGGAGIDVLSEEPPRSPNPLLSLDLPNLIVTPHVAWASREAMQTLADQLIDNIEAFVARSPKNLIS
jgi:glycerate dehydrogenase